LQRSSNRGSIWTQIYSGANRTYSQSLGNGTYQYRVRAVNNAGNSSWRPGETTCTVSLRQNSGGGGGDDSAERSRTTSTVSSTSMGTSTDSSRERRESADD
jgi:hypothetical protein